MNVILASQSPRRKELIQLLNIEALTIPSQIEEIVDSTLSDEEAVMDLAYQKAYDVFKDHKDDLVLGFDTLVILNDQIMGKPNNAEEAKSYLRALSGQTHKVITGCAMIKNGYSSSFYSYAYVTFYEMSDAEIEDYIATKEPFDKAGAYGIQGYGSKYIESISGDYYAVVGFPISKIYREINKIM
jgi:septum formation protein